MTAAAEETAPGFREERGQEEMGAEVLARARDGESEAEWRTGSGTANDALVSFALRSIMTGTAQAKLETFPQGNTPCPRASGRTLAANSVLTPFQCLALSRSNARGGRSSTHLVEGHTTLTLA